MAESSASSSRSSSARSSKSGSGSGTGSGSSESSSGQSRSSEDTKEVSDDTPRKEGRKPEATLRRERTSFSNHTSMPEAAAHASPPASASDIQLSTPQGAAGPSAFTLPPSQLAVPPLGLHAQAPQVQEAEDPLSDPLRRRAYMTQELEKFYKKNNPEKVGQAWAICGRAIDREPDLYKKLAQKYPSCVLELDWLLIAINANSKHLANKGSVSAKDSLALSERSSPVPSDESASASSGSPESAHPETPRVARGGPQNFGETFFDQYSSPFYSTRKAVQDQQKIYDGSPKEILRRSIETRLMKVDPRLLHTVDTQAMADMYIGRERDLEKALLAAASGAYSAKDGKLSTKDVKMKAPYRSSIITATYQPLVYEPLYSNQTWTRIPKPSPRSRVLLLSSSLCPPSSRSPSRGK
eukprot:TRINITY_DN21838_c0_g1_i1.p1 TRINITY_DN21838_c0_g1~~TRINITY_DN21838_c0_g1_i1.p1  ORF type:complete len:432 (+),score=81.13 TRINITY_DN21838_c0_g1_i1:66-1298(+)